MSWRTLPQLALRRLRVLHVLLHLLARRQLILRLQLIRLARRPRLRDLQRPHLRLQLRLPQHVPELRLLPLRRDLACRCDLQQHRAPRLREHVLRAQLPVRRVPLARPQPCNAILCVLERPVVHPDNLVQVRRKACVRLERRNNIVRAARRRAVPVVRRGSVRADLLRDSRNAPAAVVGRAAATIKDPLAPSGPAREFPRPNQASLFTRASRQHADGH